MKVVGLQFQAFSSASCTTASNRGAAAHSLPSGMLRFDYQNTEQDRPNQRAQWRGRSRDMPSLPMPGLVGLAPGIAEQHDDVAVGLGFDGLLLLGAFGAKFICLARAFALHPLENLLGDLPWQVGVAESDIGRGDATPAGFLVLLMPDLDQ